MTSIAIIILDTLRADFFEDHFDWLDGVRFSNAYSTSHWTVPAHASLYTGYYPSEIGMHGRSNELNLGARPMPNLFKSEGHNTRLMTANPHIYVWDGWKKGFDSAIGPSALDPSDEELVDWHLFYSRNSSTGFLKYAEAVSHAIKSSNPTVRSIWKGVKDMISDTPRNAGVESVLRRVTDVNFQSDEFLLVNLMEAHTPYNPPPEYSDVETPVDVVAGDAFAGNVDNAEEIRQVYDDSVRYLSDRYQKLYEELESDFDYIVTLSDHGEMLGEDGMWNHSYGLYPELVHIPLVISGDDVEGRIDDTIVNILDVHKTVCDLADIDVESRGQNLLDNPESRDRLFEHHGLLHWHRDQFNRKGVDEKIYEKCNRPLDGFVSADADYVYQTHDDETVIDGSLSVSEAETRLDELIEGINRQAINAEGTSENVSEEVKDRLKDLGYA